MPLLLHGRLQAPVLHALAWQGRLSVASGASGGSGASGSTGGGIFIIPNATFFVELILFLVVFGVIATVIVPPIQKAMNERQERIRASMAAGDEGRAEADRLASERQRLLDGARAEARGLIEEASRTADAALEDARRRGTAEHDALLAAARPGLEAQRQGLRADLLGRLGALVVDAASQVIGEQIEPGRHGRLIEELALHGRVASGAGATASGGGGVGPLASGGAGPLASGAGATASGNGTPSGGPAGSGAGGGS